MNRIKKGDKVGRKSYGEDIIFEVKKITKQNDGRKIAILKGITERIEVDSDVKDLVLAKRESIEKSLKKLDFKFDKKITQKVNERETRKSEQYITGKILHLDRRSPLQ